MRELDLNNAEYLGIREMILGNVNGDDFVDAGDASVLFSHIGTDGTWLEGDVNYDNFIDAGDASVLFGALGGRASIRDSPPRPYRSRDRSC